MGHIQGGQRSGMEPFIKITAVSYFFEESSILHSCEHTRTRPHMLVFIQVCYCRTQNLILQINHANTSASVLGYSLTNNSFATSMLIVLDIFLFFFSATFENFVLQFPFSIDYQQLDNIFFHKRSTRGILQQPSLVSIYRCLGDRNENQLRKVFC